MGKLDSRQSAAGAVFLEFTPDLVDLRRLDAPVKDLLVNDGAKLCPQEWGY
jgi:hypothetical protein